MRVGARVAVYSLYRSTCTNSCCAALTFVEDLNRLDGKSKEELVVDGRLASNNNQGTYTQQTVSMVDTCSIAGEASDAYNCMTPRHVE